MIEVREVSKRFGSVRALSNVSTTFARGEIHALLGENGAGKSTLMHVLAGLIRPDSGSIHIDGEPLSLGDTVETRRRGIAMVHQHFMLVPGFTVAENFALSRAAGGLQKPKTDPPRLDLGWACDPKARIDKLSVGQQQRIELQRALDGETRYLILDEPTAVLGPAEIESFFNVLRTLSASGVGIILIAHKLSEVMAIADQITVLRRGEWVTQVRKSETNPEQLVEWMVGASPPRELAESPTLGDPVVRAKQISVRDDRGATMVKEPSFEIRSGEILGIGGVDGNGQYELAEALAGIRRLSSGLLELPERIGFIPGDRRRQGLALGMSVAENLSISIDKRLLLLPWESATRARKLIDQYEIKVDSPHTIVATLSGGNQQKVVVARELSRSPQLVVAVQPTRGLDVRAARFVHEQLQKIAQTGSAVLLVSTDRDELAALANRTLFMQSGKLSEQFLEAG